MGKLAELAEQLKERDKNALDDMNSYYGGGPTIENRIDLAYGRATDALATLLQVLAYLDAQDTETPNALAQADAACGVSPGAMGSAAD